MSEQRLTETVALPPGLVHPLDLPAARRWWRWAWITRRATPWLVLAVFTAAALPAGWLALAGLSAGAVYCGCWQAARWMERTAVGHIPRCRFDSSRRSAPTRWRVIGATVGAVMNVVILVAGTHWLVSTLASAGPDSAHSIAGWLAGFISVPLGYGIAINTYWAARDHRSEHTARGGTLAVWAIRMLECLAVLVWLVMSPDLSLQAGVTRTFWVGAGTGLVVLAVCRVVSWLVAIRLGVRLAPSPVSGRVFVRGPW